MLTQAGSDRAFATRSFSAISQDVPRGMLEIRHRFSRSLLAVVNTLHGRIDLRDRDLIEAELEHADLQGANLAGATLIGANLKGADLRGANLRGADLTSALLHATELDAAEYDASTQWPVRFKAAERGARDMTPPPAPARPWWKIWG